MKTPTGGTGVCPTLCPTLCPTVRPCDESEEYFFVEGCHILETWNQPGDPAVSIARARVAPGATTRWHCLVDVTERYLILDGQGAVEIGADPAVLVGPGDLVHIPPGQAQRITAHGSGELVFLAICTPRFQAAYYRDLDESHRPRVWRPGRAQGTLSP